jgi:hypothetical protein
LLVIYNRLLSHTGVEAARCTEIVKDMHTVHEALKKNRMMDDWAAYRNMVSVYPSVIDQEAKYGPRIEKRKRLRESARAGPLGEQEHTPVSEGKLPVLPSSALKGGPPPKKGKNRSMPVLEGEVAEPQKKRSDEPMSGVLAGSLELEEAEH